MATNNSTIIIDDADDNSTDTFELRVIPTPKVSNIYQLKENK